jgi:hypothetical protein
MRLVISAMLAAALAAAGCGGHPPIPKRGVVEADLGAWHFRRFQPLLDVEVWVEGNKAEAFTASYVADSAEKVGHVEDKDIVNVFVTRYERDAGIVREAIKLARRLAQEKGYQVDEDKIGGARVLRISGHSELWVMWPSKKHVVKVGGRGRGDVPSGLVSSYADRYPSTLPGGALEGPLPEEPKDGKNAKGKPEDDKSYDVNAPEPDWKRYDPKNAKTPPKDKAPDDGDDAPKKK